MKKLLVTAVAIALAGTALAAKKAPVVPTIAPTPPAPVTVDNFTGFYAGVGMLHANLYTKETINETYTGGSASLGNNAGFDQIGGKLFAGYGKAFNHYYLGLEALYQYLPNNGGYTLNGGTPYGTDGFSARDNWLLAVRGGYVCNNWMPYIFLGPSYTYFKYTAQDFTATTDNIKKLTKRAWGFTPGIGVQYMLNENLGFDLRYAYTFYSTITANPSAYAANSFEVKFKPTMSVFGLSVLYRF